VEQRLVGSRQLFCGGGNGPRTMCFHETVASIRSTGCGVPTPASPRTLQVGPVPRNAGGGFRFAQERSAESSARSGALGAPCLFARRGEREAPPLAPVGRATAREELASLGDAHDAGVRGRALGVL